MPERFADARRELPSLTAAVEKKALLWLAARMPPWVGSDHLTALGLLAMAAAGAAYVAARESSAWLHVVNVLLVVNWFGDSLDGTLARYRNRSRPRYGFYVDHMADAVAVLLLLGGLGISGFMSPAVAVGLLVAYYLMSIHIYLATHALGVFRIAYARLGGTELRLLLMLGNLALLVVPRINLGGRTVLLFDVAGALALVGLLVVGAVAVGSSVRALYRLEPLP